MKAAAREMKGGHQAKDGPGQDREPQCKGEDLTVDADLFRGNAIRDLEAGGVVRDD